jgi:hypothetical protein
MINDNYQECFNSPYGHTHFPVYAENIGFTPGESYNVQESASESVKMLSATAKEVGAWLVGGISCYSSLHSSSRSEYCV